MDSSLGIIAWLSFITALSGAMSPGPLFTYTIIKSIQSKKHGALMSVWIILGHAILEVGIIVILILGFSQIFQNPTVIRIIGVAGGLLLIFFGFSLLRDLVLQKIPVDFLPKEKEKQTFEEEQIPPHSSQSTEYADHTDLSNKTNPKSKDFVKNPVLGGILVSASNPYWWVWWATIGFAFMIQWNISFSNLGVLAFFIGHEMGDLIWYVFVATMTHYGKRSFDKRIYYGILAACGVFMIIFGGYLGISPFF